MKFPEFNISQIQYRSLYDTPAGCNIIAPPLTSLDGRYPFSIMNVSSIPDIGTSYSAVHLNLGP